MHPFSYGVAEDVAGAVREVAADGRAKLIAGGTNLLDLMKEDVERPSRLIDIRRLPLYEIRDAPDGGLRLGALATNTDVAYDERVELRVADRSRQAIEVALARGEALLQRSWRNVDAGGRFLQELGIRNALAVAVEVVRTVCGGDFELVDITGDPDLERRYRAVIPLVEIDGEERFRFEVDEEDLRALL